MKRLVILASKERISIIVLPIHNLAKSIVDAGWNQLVQFTTYKAESAGKQVIQVDPYNTSQTCSECGQIVKKDMERQNSQMLLCLCRRS
ncbi:zinc ribbon domain-containing protein [Thermoflavimicrobium daqui]|uniref:Cas12f1-like TNB domain-containing protein n=1 Tax=Thermoflavimicrobium daqui TaxID=2137476 RepID=A0A364K4N1_9BACL|nr:zinc ribbon domain-containing protein [Thermoflavimicrobium daqui]RAL24251.1 hypothetical protein DL897_11265 [Thermoflavimicrobium daqui]